MQKKGQKLDGIELEEKKNKMVEQRILSDFQERVLVNSLKNDGTHFMLLPMDNLYPIQVRGHEPIIPINSEPDKRFKEIRQLEESGLLYFELASYFKPGVGFINCSDSVWAKLTSEGKRYSEELLVA